MADETTEQPRPGHLFKPLTDAARSLNTEPTEQAGREALDEWIVVHQMPMHDEFDNYLGEAVLVESMRALVTAVVADREALQAKVERVRTVLAAADAEAERMSLEFGEPMSPWADSDDLRAALDGKA